MRSPVLFVPGLRDYVADHWQTLAAAEIDGARTVPPLEHDKLNCAARIAAVDRAIAECDAPPILVAHSAGVLMVVHWAQKHRRPIKGALLATPPDLDRPLPEGYPKIADLKAEGWLPTPRNQLWFPSILAASTNDPLDAVFTGPELARAWGSRLVELGDVGHLNPAAGYGPWPMAHQLIAELNVGAGAAP
jgi:hypothetical protein